MDSWIQGTLRAVPCGLRYAGSHAEAERVVLSRDHRAKRSDVIAAQANEPGKAYSTVTTATPASMIPSARAALVDTSMIRPRTNGPRSLTRHWIERPACVTVTMLPKARVRCAQVISPRAPMP